MSDKNRILSYAEPSTESTSINDGYECRSYDRYCFPTRYIIAIWGFMGFMIVYALRVNLSVAILAMVNNTALNENLNITPECHFPSSNRTKLKDGEFVWDRTLQGIILGAFFWGYIPLQIPAGWIAVSIGGKWLFGFGVLWTSVLTLLTPAAAKWGSGSLIALRVLEGAGESITYPAMHSMLGYWSPTLETTFIGAIVYSGSFAGLVVGLLVSSVLIEANVMGGWPSVFYIPGIAGCLWFLIWSFVAYSTPAKHPRISKEERLFIESSVNISHKEMLSVVPWERIFLSMPVWAISVTNFCAMWSLYTLLTCLPQYFEYILGFSITENGLLNALPYFLSAISFILSGKAADMIRTRGLMSTTVTRKFFNTLGMLFNAIFIIAITFIGCDRVLVVTFLCIAVALGTINSAGYNVNHIDIAPQYAGVLYGITNSIATVAGIIGPFIVGILTDKNETRARWEIIFFLSSGITLFGTVFFLIFGSGERQPWAIDKTVIEVYPEDD